MNLLSKVKIKIPSLEDVDQDARELLTAIAQDDKAAIGAARAVVTEDLIQMFINQLKTETKGTKWYESKN